MSSTNSKQSVFKRSVLSFYKKHGRHALPWRKTRDPYKILVSEIMLQQTQVERVVSYYRNFIQKFPTAKSLARAPLSEVLILWQGLGYNRRAKMLHRAGKEIAGKHRGIFPLGYRELLALPGVGPYTASAIRVFAFNEPEILIETNVRAAYLHHFFPRGKNVPDSKILPLIRVPQGRAREWYSALMDYGAHLKATMPNPSRKSAHHAKQKPFKGSDREIRGAILKMLAEKKTSAKSIFGLPFPKARLTAQLHALNREGLISKRGETYALAD